MEAYRPAEKPTLGFIGVSTGGSSIFQVFPRWAEYLNLGDCRLEGIDLPLHSQPAVYRRLVCFIKEDPHFLGAIITSHKIDLFRASADLFDELDADARLTAEVSCICKREDRLIGLALDPVSSGLALGSFLPESYWQQSGAEVFVIGSGGAALAITVYLSREKHGANRPSRINISDRDPTRLAAIKRIHEGSAAVPRSYHLIDDPRDNDNLINGLSDGSLIINATGLGKDAPGSPITDRAVFPRNGFVWELNYRGQLLFLEQAGRQKHERSLTIEDGWIYFIHGWTRAIAEVFRIEIPTKGSRFEDLLRIA